jgi:hypothetical protein
MIAPVPATARMGAAAAFCLLQPPGRTIRSAV